MTTDEVIDKVVAIEGRYSNNPSDPGGETMFGVTKAVARANGYLGPMRDMPRSTAVRIFKHEYVIAPMFDMVFDMYPKLGAELIDSGINCGVKRASLWLQHSLNGLNRRGKDFANLVEDGRLGKNTLYALKQYKALRGDEGEDVIRKCCDIQQGAHYIDLASNDSKFEDFLYGWIRTRTG